MDWKRIINIIELNKVRTNVSSSFQTKSWLFKVFSFDDNVIFYFTNGVNFLQLSDVDDLKFHDLTSQTNSSLSSVLVSDRFKKELSLVPSKDTQSSEVHQYQLRMTCDALPSFENSIYLSSVEKFDSTCRHLVTKFCCMSNGLHDLVLDLCQLLKRKDDELHDYKKSGVQLTRRSLRTSKFDFDEFVKNRNEKMNGCEPKVDMSIIIDENIKKWIVLPSETHPSKIKVEEAESIHEPSINHLQTNSSLQNTSDDEVDVTKNSRSRKTKIISSSSKSSKLKRL